MLRKNLKLLMVSGIVASTLCGCGTGQVLEKTQKPSDPINIEDASDGYYILTKDNKLYSPNTMYQTFSGTTNSANPDRLIYSAKNSKFIPKLYEDDKLVYFSDKEIPEKFMVESFNPTGYTIGIFGISKTSTGEYGFSDSTVIPQSAFSENGVDGNYVFETVNGRKLNTARLTKAGTIKGLKKNEKVKLSCMKGTKYGELSTTADTRCFYSAYTENITKYKKTKNGYIILELPKGNDYKYISVEDSGLIERVKGERR